MKICHRSLHHTISLTPHHRWRRRRLDGVGAGEEATNKVLAAPPRPRTDREGTDHKRTEGTTEFICRRCARFVCQLAWRSHRLADCPPSTPSHCSGAQCATRRHLIWRLSSLFLIPRKLVPKKKPITHSFPSQRTTDIT
jgi:hypothetical protein